jgi:hypothetical protein
MGHVCVDLVLIRAFSPECKRETEDGGFHSNADAVNKQECMSSWLSFLCYNWMLLM